MADILRFRKFLADVASGDDWEYGDGEPMAEDAREFLRKADEVCAERDAAREKLEAADKVLEGARERIVGKRKYVSADLTAIDIIDEARAAIKAEGE